MTREWAGDDRPTAILERVTSIVHAHADLPAGAAAPGADDDLWDAGMNSLASVKIMVAVEESFGLEFPDEILSRATFGRIRAIADAVNRLLDVAQAPR